MRGLQVANPDLGVKLPLAIRQAAVKQTSSQT
jgi:hypothetical protein